MKLSKTLTAKLTEDLRTTNSVNERFYDRLNSEENLSPSWKASLERLIAANNGRIELLEELLSGKYNMGYGADYIKTKTSK